MLYSAGAPPLVHLTSDQSDFDDGVQSQAVLAPAEQLTRSSVTHEKYQRVIICELYLLIFLYIGGISLYIFVRVVYRVKSSSLTGVTLQMT